MVYTRRLRGKGGPAHAVDGVEDYGPTRTVCTQLGDRKLFEDGVVCDVWDQSPDGELVAGALSRARGHEAGGPVAEAAPAAAPDARRAGGGDHRDEAPASEFLCRRPEQTCLRREKHSCNAGLSTCPVLAEKW